MIYLILEAPISRNIDFSKFRFFELSLFQCIDSSILPPISPAAQQHTR